LLLTLSAAPRAPIIRLTAASSLVVFALIVDDLSACGRLDV
jgi:hypothetical protein